MNELIAGIDLGTTNSEISFVIDSEVITIPVNGEPVMPSCVGIDQNGKLLVGKAAKNQMVSSPDDTILSIKRKMGQDTFVSLGGCRFSPEEISAAILSELKFQAEKYLDRKFSKAVITVPAFFQDHQRQATIEAGKLANLDVIRIINEPTAAAVAYDTKMENNQRILVYDLGGGTFDVSLVLVENGVVEVKSSHGDTFLGGDDFDQLILELLFDSIYNKHQIDLSSNTAIRYRLWKAVEKAKRELSDSPFAKIQEEFITGDIHIDFELSRSEYEQLITPILMQTLDCVHHCLKDAACLPSSIDRILLVGGATRTPLIHSMLQKEFGILPRHEINPDLIVSMGAAIHGAVISGSKHHSILVDITPHTFGTGVLEMEESGANPEKYIPIIKRNTPLPASKTEAFSTVYDNQETIEVTVYQGENENVSDNFLIGKFLVKGLSKVPAGNCILINFQLNLNNILIVTATEKSTGLSKTVELNTAKMNRQINDRQIESFLINNESIAIIGNTDLNSSIAEARDLKIRAEKLFNSGLNSEDATELKNILEKSRDAIARGELDLLKEYNTSLENLLFYLE